MSQDEFNSHKSAPEKSVQKTGLLRNKSGLNQEYGPQDSSQIPTSGSTVSLDRRWLILCNYSEVEQEGLYPFEVDRENSDYPIVLINKAGQFYALHDECPHRRVKLSSQGYLDDEHIYCGFHHWGFKIDSGAHLLPTGICVEHYPIKLENKQVLIGVTW